MKFEQDGRWVRTQDTADGPKGEQGRSVPRPPPAPVTAPPQS